MEGPNMGGRSVRRTWQHDPTLYAAAQYRRACEYETFIPDPLGGQQITLPGDVAGIVSDAEKAIADLNASALPEFVPLARLLLRTESIASSKVEGLQVDTRDLGRAEAKLDAGRRVGPQALDVLANIEAMELAIENATNAGPLDPAGICAIHRVLMAHDERIKRPGEFRKEQNWIGGNDYNPCGATYVPPPPDEVAALIDDLCGFVDSETLPPLLQAAIAHAQFETIHPFVDGNGRTGRALIHVILRRRGLTPHFVPPISVILAKRREGYVQGLELYRRDDLPEWTTTFASAAAESAVLALRYRGLVHDLQLRWRERLASYSNPREDSASWAIIDVLPARPVVSVPLLTAATGRSRAAVTNAVAELERAGVLIPMSDSKRYRSFEADGLLDLIARLEAGEP